MPQVGEGESTMKQDEPRLSEWVRPAAVDLSTVAFSARVSA